MAAASATAVSTRPAGTSAGGAGAGDAKGSRPRAMVAVPACREAVGPRATGHDQRAPVAAVVALLALLMLGWPLAGLVGGATTTAEASGPSPVPVAAAAGSVHVVQPGDTYWSIARGLRGPGDVRPTVDALMAANGERPLVAGDRLLVPLGEYAGEAPGGQPRR